MSVPHRPDPLPQLSRSFEDLLRPCAHSNIAGEIAPADGARAVHEKLGRAGDVVAASDAVFVEDAVSGDRCRVRISEQREGVAGFVAQIARLLGRVDADRNRLDAGGAKVDEMLFDTP
ncbi:MAG TPA: hypothetical protein VGQ21_00385 [Thermoanaerobaculia bacterium]|nr:hypothetical protein [Thermoanaerobaculia bacterium]